MKRFRMGFLWRSRIMILLLSRIWIINPIPSNRASRYLVIEMTQIWFSSCRTKSAHWNMRTSHCYSWTSSKRSSLRSCSHTSHTSSSNKTRSYRSSRVRRLVRSTPRDPRRGIRLDPIQSRWPQRSNPLGILTKGGIRYPVWATQGWNRGDIGQHQRRPDRKRDLQSSNSQCKVRPQDRSIWRNFWVLWGGGRIKAGWRMSRFERSSSNTYSQVGKLQSNMKGLTQRPRRIGPDLQPHQSRSQITISIGGELYWIHHSDLKTT